MNFRIVLSVSIAVFRRSEAIEFLSSRLAIRAPTRLAFANANLLNLAFTDPDLRHLLEKFVILNDGVGVSLASRILYGNPFPENLNGTDFCPTLLNECSVPLRIYLLGGCPSIAFRAASTISTRWPRHVIVGTQHGFYAPSEFAHIKEAIARARPDIVFVAIGNGRQERVVEELVPSCVPFACGVGALFDFLAGEVPRAPRILRIARLEWIFRLCLEPKRLWRRYIVGNPVFLWRVLQQRVGISQD